MLNKIILHVPNIKCQQAEKLKLDNEDGNDDFYIALFFKKKLLKIYDIMKLEFYSYVSYKEKKIFHCMKEFDKDDLNGLFIEYSCFVDPQ